MESIVQREAHVRRASPPHIPLRITLPLSDCADVDGIVVAHWPFMDGTIIAAACLGIFFASTVPTRAASAAPAALPSPGAHVEIAFRDGKMTARLADASVREIMAEVTKVSGAPVQWLADAGDDTISLSFKNRPIADAIERILRPRSFLLYWSAAGGAQRLSRIVVMSPTNESAIPDHKPVADASQSPRPDSRQFANTFAGFAASPGQRGGSGGGRSGGASADGADAELQRGELSTGGGSNGGGSTGQRSTGGGSSNGQAPIGLAAAQSSAKATAAPTPRATASPTPADLCGKTPRTRCHVSTVGRGGVFSIDEKTDQRSGAFVWKWLEGEATTRSELGDPRKTTSYSLCVYGEDASLVATATANAAAKCGANDCWKETPLGFKYRAREHGDRAIASIDLKAGVSGKAKIVVNGTGAELHKPIPTITEPLVTVELINGNDECWSATYRSHVEINSPERFRARAD